MDSQIKDDEEFDDITPRVPGPVTIDNHSLGNANE